MTERPDWADAWESVRRQRAELGRSLVQWRRIRRLTQEGLRDLVQFSVITVSNAELGQQCPGRPFWQAADNALRAEGVLLAAFDELDVAVRAQQQVEARAGEAAGAGARRPGFALRGLTPHASPQHFLGAELRAWRLYRGLSLDTVSQQTLVTGSLLGRIEKAERTATAAVIEACDAVLETGGALARLLAYQDARAAEPVPAAVPAVTPSLVIQIVTGGNAGEDDGSPQYPVFDGTGARVIRLADVRQRRR